MQRHAIPHPRVTMVSVEDGITAIGFRKVVSSLKTLFPQTEVLYVATGNLYSLKTHLLPHLKGGFGEQDIEVISQHLAQSDILGFSTMTPSASYASAIIRRVKELNPSCYVIWGGTHCVLNPEVAIQDADAVCIGEGERPIREMVSSLQSGKDETNIQGMWFRKGSEIIKNPLAALYKNDELSEFPPPYFEFDAQFYDLKNKKIRPYTAKDYINFNGLAYRVVWTLGCPYKCSFCAQTAFNAIDKDYAKIRHSSIETIMTELEYALSTHPFISSIAFYDDNLIALNLEKIKQFTAEYKKRIGLPFVVFGLYPTLISEEKIRLLVDAGMNRARMGIQAGTDEMLDFYDRNTKLETVRKSANILARVAREHNMIPPAYDIINDNPLETKDNVISTLEFLYSLERPYTLTLFSLRLMPKTNLDKYFQENASHAILASLNTSYLDTKKSLTNILFHLLASFRPPRFVFNWFINRVRKEADPPKSYPVLFWLTKTLYLGTRALSHLKRLDFSTIVGPASYLAWRSGLMRVAKAKRESLRLAAMSETNRTAKTA